MYIGSEGHSSNLVDEPFRFVVAGAVVVGL